MHDEQKDKIHSHFVCLSLVSKDLFMTAIGAEGCAQTQPDLCAIRLRGLCEDIAKSLIKSFGDSENKTTTQFERLKHLQENIRVPSDVLSRFHSIRLLGNKAAHNQVVSLPQVLDLVEDAAGLCRWFCGIIRPDIDWSRPIEQLLRAQIVLELSQSRGNVVRFPVERVLRVSDEAVKETEAPTAFLPTMRSKLALRDAFDQNLSEDQIRAVSALEAFLQDENARIFQLTGYAGTGKTFLALGLTQYFLAQGRQFALAAPTGRAAQVIGEKTLQNANTLHRLIYDYEDTAFEGEEDDLTYKIIAKVAQNATAINAVYIVDEASLIADIYSESEFFRSGSGFLLRDLIQYVGIHNRTSKRKLIFLGDPAQLPPVGMNRSPALDGEYLKQTYGIDVSGYELTEVMRQKADSSVARNVLPLRESLALGQFSGLSFQYDEDVVHLGTDQVPGIYLKIREHRGADAPIIITWSNAESTAFNTIIRARLFPDRETVCAGDLVIAASNTFSGEHIVMNGEFLHVQSAEPVVERRSVPLKRKHHETGQTETVDIALSFREVSLRPLNSVEDDVTFTARILDGFLHGPDGTPDSDTLRALYVDFVTRNKDIDRRKNAMEFKNRLKTDPYFNALRLRFGYSVTCHKAQGGEWSHVIVKCPKRGDPRNRDYFRWLYTAMTRTSGKLYLVDPPETRIKAPKPPISPLPPQDLPLEATVATPPSIAPDTAFKNWLQDSVSACLIDTDVEIEDITHYPYRAAYYFKRGPASERIDISFKGNFVISSIAPTRLGDLSVFLQSRLSVLIGKRAPASSSVLGQISAPSRPFLRIFHDSFVTSLAKRGITITGLAEYDWHQRYTLSRDVDDVMVDIWFDSKNRIKSFTPVRAAPNPSPSFSGLQTDIETILTTEVRL